MYTIEVVYKTQKSEKGLAMDWLTNKHASEYLKISEGTLANLRSRGTIPYFKVPGAGIRYLKEDLDVWISEYRYQSLQRDKR